MERTQGEAHDMEILEPQDVTHRAQIEGDHDIRRGSCGIVGCVHLREQGQVREGDQVAAGKPAHGVRGGLPHVRHPGRVVRGPVGHRVYHSHGEGEDSQEEVGGIFLIHQYAIVWKNI